MTQTDEWLSKLTADMQALERKYEELGQTRKQLRLLLQTSCTHDNILEAPWRNTGYSAHPEWRVCTRCGLAEEGWGCGFQLLHGRDGQKVTEVPKSEAYRYRHGPTYRNSSFVHTVTHRQEGITLQQLICSVIKEGLGA